jgi:hypothetical protein
VLVLVMAAYAFFKVKGGANIEPGVMEEIVAKEEPPA